MATIWHSFGSPLRCTLPGQRDRCTTGLLDGVAADQGGRHGARLLESLVRFGSRVGSFSRQCTCSFGLRLAGLRIGLRAAGGDHDGCGPSRNSSRLRRALGVGVQLDRQRQAVGKRRLVALFALANVAIGGQNTTG